MSSEFRIDLPERDRVFVREHPGNVTIGDCRWNTCDSDRLLTMKGDRRMGEDGRLEDIKREVRDYILEEFLDAASADELEDDTPLITGAILASTGTGLT